jgi:hypothetical protein
LLKINLINKTKKILFIFLGAFIFFGALNFSINIWAESKLPKLINNQNNTDYNITYKDIDLSIWSSRITAYNVSVSPKNNIQDSYKKIGLYGNIELIEVNEFDIWSVLFGKKIKANNLVISQPNIVLYKNNENAVNDYNNINSKVFKPFEKIIIVSDLYLNNGTLKILNIEKNETLVNAYNINFNLEGIVLNEKTLNQKIPVVYKKFSFICDSLFYKLDAYYELKSKKITANERSLTIKNFELIPTCTRSEFVQKISKEKDLYTVLVDNIFLKNTNWGFKNESFFFKTNSILLNKLNANVYRGKMPSDDLSKKELYNKLLRNIKIDIKVDSLIIKNSFLTYEEEKTFEKGPGKLYFSNFNLLAENIESGNKKSKLPDVKIKINCSFMKRSPLKVDWSFNVLDKTDGFKISGSIKKFNTEKLEDFTKPYMNIIIKGDLDEVYFNFAGNDFINKGTFSIKYDDLNVEIYQNDKRLKKNKFLSAIGNLFIKNDSDEEVKAVEIEVERNQEKSFYNFLWISLADGLKQILL